MARREYHSRSPRKGGSRHHSKHKRSRSRSSSPDSPERSWQAARANAKRQRNYRKAQKDPSAAVEGTQAKVDAVQLEEEALGRIQAAVAERYAAAIAGPEIKERIAARLKQERARLEARLETQLEEERQALLEKKRKIREEARKQQEELERILEENKRRVEEAQAKAAAAAAVGGSQQGDVGSGPSSSRAGSNPQLQRPAIRAGSGMILVE